MVAYNIGSTTMSSLLSLDVHHLYYLHPSDNERMQITIVVLIELNFNQQSCSMKIVLSLKFKLGFVDVSYQKLEISSLLLDYWIRCRNFISCDTDRASNPNTRQSLTDFCVLFGGSFISWKCKKQHVASRSSVDADTCCEQTWIVSLLHELQFKSIMPITHFCDNKSALHIASNLVFHEHTKHMEIDCHLVRQKLQQHLITTHYITIHEQPAEFFATSADANCASSMSLLESQLQIVERI